MITIDNIFNRPQETTLLRDQRTQILSFININTIGIFLRTIASARC
nr:MAG TPA: hypothetical protein [Caudoviricetes sp.]